MQVKIEEVSAVEKRVAVEIPWELVRAKINEAYRDLGRKVQLKGFRKGHVPREMLERLYGKVVERDVTRDLVRESFSMAAEEHDLHPVADPIVDEVDLAQGRPFRYSARCEVRTEFEPKDYEGLALERREPKATDEEIDKALERRRQSQIELKPIEGRARTTDSDVVTAELTGTIGEISLSKRELQVDLGLRPEEEPIPGLAGALVGMPLDAVEQHVAFEVPVGSRLKEIAGTKASLTVTVKGAREKVLPALDDEFAKDTGEADTLAELREKVRAKLMEEARERSDRELRDHAVKELVKHNQIPIAPALVERQLDVIVRRARSEFGALGLDQALLDEDKMRRELRDVAADEVRAALLLDAIADKEKVEVKPEDLDRRVAKIAELRSQNPSKARAELARSGQLAAIQYALREEKVLDLILSKATIKNNVSAE